MPYIFDGELITLLFSILNTFHSRSFPNHLRSFKLTKTQLYIIKICTNTYHKSLHLTAAFSSINTVGSPLEITVLGHKTDPCRYNTLTRSPTTPPNRDIHVIILTQNILTIFHNFRLFTYHSTTLLCKIMKGFGAREREKERYT